LLVDKGVRILAWVNILVSLCGNVFVLSYRNFASSTNLGNNAIITSLALSDIMMSFYLLGMVIADHVYMDKYILHEESWTSSINCKTLTCLSTTSSEMSFFIGVFLPYFYLYAVGFRKSKGGIKPLKLYGLCCLIWLVSLLLGLTPVLLLDIKDNHLCLLFTIGQSSKMIYYNIGVFVVLNGLLMIGSMLPEFLLAQIIRKSQQAVQMKGHVSRRKSLTAIYMWLFILVLFNMVCCIPIQILLVLSVSGYQLDDKFLQWFIVLIVPLSSNGNPFLHTVRPIMFKAIKSLQMKTTIT